jgi:hypothetical protein
LGIKKIIIALSLLIMVGCTNASRGRSIGYVQQETPGAIIVVGVFEHGEKYIAAVNGFGKETVDKTIPLRKEDFENLWVITISEEFSQYKYTPLATDNVATPESFTVIITDSTALKSHFKFPKAELNDSAKRFVEIIKSLMAS